MDATQTKNDNNDNNLPPEAPHRRMASTVLTSGGVIL